jgi:hypothetical protein
MKLRILLSGIVLNILTISSYGQTEGVVEKFAIDFWKDSTALTVLTPEEKELKGVFIKDIHIKKFLYDSYFDERTQKFISDILQEENLYYKRIRLNNDAAVEMYNKVYIPTAGGRKVTKLKARAITKDGKIIKFDDSNKKEIENYENAGPFTIFALEGIEVGSEIEFTYTTSELADNYYFKKITQGSFPKREFHYEIVSPSNLVFQTKSYNGLAELIMDTVHTEVNRYVIDVKNVKQFKEEQYSLGDALMQKVEAKLKENTTSFKRNFYSWNEAAIEYSNYIYSPSNEKKVKAEKKALKKFIKATGFASITDKREQITTIEHYLKSNFEFTGGGGYFADDIIESKRYSKFSAVRFTALILKALDIDHQVVMTSNRFSSTFDADFETYNSLETFLLYIPKFDQFLDPTNEFMRLGLIPSNYAYTKGLFIKVVEIGGDISAFPEIKEIPGTSADITYDNLTVDIKFSEDLESIKAHLKHEVKGYIAAYLRPVMPYLDADKKKEILENRLKQIGSDAVITNITTKNEEMKGYMLDKPYIFEGDAEVNSLLESAGNKILLKVGQVIGGQVEMYQDTSRKYGVENVYNHGYNRVINITIPEGYEISNINDLNMEVFYKEEGKSLMAFTSKYTLEGNQLSITCNEFYNIIRLPVEKYNAFRTVINAAADWNKITLILKNKG